MGIPTNYKEPYDYNRITGNETMDVQEMLARQKLNTLWTNFRLETEDEKLKELFDNIKTNNELLLIFKGVERYLSKHGKHYLKWDIFEPKELGSKERKVLFFPSIPNQHNETVRFAQQKEYAGVISIQPTSIANGINITLRQMITTTQTQTIVMNSGIPEKNVPIDMFYFETPQFLKAFMKPGTRNHNYGVLSMKEILNKNIVDFNGVNDVFLPDDYPVIHLRDMINGMLVFYKKEQVKNSTKWVGNAASYQQVYKVNPDAANYLAKQQGINKEVYNQMNNQEQGTILEDDYIMSVNGNNLKIDKIQSTFSGEEIARAITSLMELYFNGAGMDYSVQSLGGQSQYTNISGIQTQNRRTIETIKECIILREKQYTDILNDVIDAWFGVVGKHKEFQGKWDFKILSNIVNQEQYATDNIIMKQENNLISNKVAIKQANKDMSEYELNAMIADIEKEKAEQQAREDKMMEQNNGEI